ncbi:dihydrolipoamide acetyltransferase family protein [Streptomyces sp. NPDC006285]|uniref:dihydrolipoamide acetyltransferase family protein n=1 Tax=Streptomyces sp. NPDC006285 TaxID=3364742 RepID=UPI0036BA720A
MTTFEFTLPDLGEGLTEAEIVAWLVREGDQVTVDQPVVEVETAKTRVEIPSPRAGRVAALPALAGTVLPVGAPLILLDLGENAVPGRPSSAGSADEAEEQDTAGGRQHAEAPAAALIGYGPTGPPTVPVKPGASTVQDRPCAVVSPVVRRLAREHGLDLRTLPGTGPGGLITRNDVRQAIEGTAADDQGRTDQTTRDVRDPRENRVHRVPLRGGQLATARKFELSHRELPCTTCWLTVDATELVRAAATLGPGIGVTALLTHSCLTALAEHPELNARVDGARDEIVRSRAVYLSLAVQSPLGLRTPVVPEADRLSLRRLADELDRLIGLAREGRLSPVDMGGGTFTLNNYGVLGVDGATPLLNYPEGAMLGVGRLADRPWVVDGELCVRTTVQLSLTFDHRLCDGERGASFLRRVADFVKQPLCLLEARTTC